jgi:hypothetical protein
MRLIRDEQAYFRILDDFVARRVGAAVFMARFRHQWQGDGAEGIDSVLAMSAAPHDPGGLHALLEAVESLCTTYAHDLPPGCGYRVSEEQFRKEVASLTGALPHPGLDRA